MASTLGAGLAANAAFFFTRQIGVNLFCGVADLTYKHDTMSYPRSTDQFFGGGELELIVFRLSLLRFENLIEGSALLGASTLARASDNWVSAHVGARLSLNLGDRWSITGVGRANLGYQQLEAGISLHI